MTRGGGYRHGVFGYSTRQCIHCGQTNHTTEYCYDLHENSTQHATDSVMTISSKEYQRLISSHTIGPSMTMLAQTESATACVVSSSSP